MFLAGSLAGCATEPVNPWETIDVSHETPAEPVRLPDFPTPADFTEDTVTFDLDGAQRLDAFKTAAEANTGIAEDHAAQVRELHTAVENLVEAGAHQRAIADMRAEMLQDERRHHFFEKIGLWALVIGVVATK